MLTATCPPADELTLTEHHFAAAAAEGEEANMVLALQRVGASIDLHLYPSALALAEHIAELHRQGHWRFGRVLELGAGCGLCSYFSHSGLPKLILCYFETVAAFHSLARISASSGRSRASLASI